MPLVNGSQVSKKAYTTAFLVERLADTDNQLQRFQQALNTLECIILGKFTDYIQWRRRQLLTELMKVKATDKAEEVFQQQLFDYETD